MVQAATPGPVTGGLSGSYFNNQALSGAPLFTRKEAVDFSLSGTWPGTGLGPNGFSVRWSGKLVVPSTGSYTFQTESDDGIRLFVAGQQLINNWTEHASTLDTSGAVALTAGQQVDIVIEYFQGGGGAVAKLLWRTPGAPGFVVVPGAQLVPGSVAPINRQPSVTTPPGQTATVGTARSLQISASDPDGDVLSFSAVGLPPGLAINASSGLVSGTPSTAGSFNAVVTVSDGKGGTAAASFGWALTTAANRAPSVNSPGAQATIVGSARTLQVGASDPDGDVLRYGATGLPPGLSINSGSGLISGTPSTVGNFTTAVTVSDEKGATAATSFGWAVTAAANRAPSINNPGAQSATAGIARTLQISASDPDGDTITYVAVGMPPGLLINSSGLISGTPSTAGSFNPSVTVVDGKGGTATTSFVWTVQGSTPGVVVGGLTGSYFSNRDLSGTPVLVRKEGVNFDWGLSSPGPGVSGNDFSVRWAGKLIVPTTGNYVFATESDDGVRLYVNGVLVINNWTLHARTLDQSAGYSLVAGQQLDIVMEFYEATNEAVARLLWKTPGANNFVVIPSAQLGTVSAPAVSTTRSWEAELGQFGGGSRVQTASNAAAGQLVGNINSVGAFTQVTVDRGTNGGMVSLVVRYSNGYGQTKSLSLYVNGSRLQQIRFPSTGGWNNFADAAVVRFSLNAGINTLRLQRDAADELSADIDRFTISY